MAQTISIIKEEFSSEPADGYAYRTPPSKRKVISEGRIFKAFSLEGALKKCEEEGYRALFMPEITKQRILQEKGSLFWKETWTWWGLDSISLVASGKTKRGVPVVVVAHVPHYFSDWRNIRKARKEGFEHGAGLFPQEEFYELLDREDSEEIFVLDHQTLMQAPYGIQQVNAAIEHPFIKPSFGLPEQEIALYFEKHKNIYGNKIGIWYPRQVNDVPRGGLLFLGINSDVGLNGNYCMYINGRFVGVRERSEQLVPKARELYPDRRLKEC